MICNTNRNIFEYIALLNDKASGKWELERIITHEFLLNELERAIRTAGDVDHAGNVVVNLI